MIEKNRGAGKLAVAVALAGLSFGPGCTRETEEPVVGRAVEPVSGRINKNGVEQVPGVFPSTADQWTAVQTLSNSSAK